MPATHRDLQGRGQGDDRHASCSSSGKRIYKGMRVSFRWPRGALATKLDHTRVGYVARVPAGHARRQRLA